MEDCFKTILKAASFELIVKHSKFIGNASYVENSEEALKFIEKIKNENLKATHNVVAYVLKKGNVSFCSDDGEPHRTAGWPVLNVLKNEELFNVCVVVTRYFGGVLLGTGGLVSAYSETCKGTIEKAGLVNCFFCDEIVLNFKYCHLSKIEYVFKKFNVNVFEKTFEVDVKIRAFVKFCDSDSLKLELIKQTAGCLKFEVVNQCWSRICTE